MVFACGGKAERPESPEPEAPSCEFLNNTYADGSEFLASDGCNICSCTAGVVTCAQTECIAHCIEGTRVLEVGQRFPADAGCNECTCVAAGELSCTHRACLRCEEYEAKYDALVEGAKRCDPTQPNQCTKRVRDHSEPCRCDMFVNPERWDESVREIPPDTVVTGCFGGQHICLERERNECLAAVTGSCSLEGRCVTDRGPTVGVGCKVGGVTYPSGAKHIEDPFSCNQCECRDGVLECVDLANCPKPCPAGTARGTSCVQCGPVDDCPVVETACLPACETDCDEGVCIQGVCKNVCG